MAVITYTKTGNKATTPAKLDKGVFGVSVNNHDILHRAYVAYLANGRRNLAVTLKRGEVSGGGKKPWRQKGTGRARFGSSRNPIWRGGGIAFGPTGQENYTKKLPASTKRLALRQALSLAAKDDRIIVIEEFAIASAKSKDAAALLRKLGAKNRVLVVNDKPHEGTERSLRNLSGVQLKQYMYVNVQSVLDADTIILTKDALSGLTSRLEEKK